MTDKKFDALKDLTIQDDWALAKEINRCPAVNEARQMLGLTAAQFSKLMDFSRPHYYRIMWGEATLSIGEKLLLVRILDEAKRRNLLVGFRK